jgi:hypothetical protein
MKMFLSLGLVHPAYNPSTCETKVRGSRVLASLGYIVRPYPPPLHQNQCIRGVQISSIDILDLSRCVLLPILFALFLMFLF